MKEKRDCIVTYSKAIGIILMVIGHSGPPSYIKDFIYAFHMPLFFILSGYCFKEEYFEHSVGFICKKIKNLYMPYVKWSVIFVSIHFVLMRFKGYSGLFHGEYYYDLFCWIKQVLFIFFTMSKTPTILGGFWFLKSLLLASIMALFIMKNIHSIYLRFLVLLVPLFLIKFLNISNSAVDIISLAMLSTVFFITGKFLKGKKIAVKYIPILCLIVVLVGIFSPAEMSTVSYITLFPFIISGISGTYIVTFFCSKIKGENSNLTNWLNLVGNNTLFILTWHLLIFKLTSLIAIIVYKLPLAQITSTPIIQNLNGWWIAYTCISMIVITVLLYVKRKLYL